MNAKPDTTFSYSGGAALENMHEAVLYNEAIVQMLIGTGMTNESQILDFGAGVGTFATMLRERGRRVDCLEIDATESGVLREKGFVVFENLAHVPYDTYDVIYSLNVLEHIADHEEVLVELYKKLKPGGKLFVYVPAFQLLYSDFDAMLGHVRRYHLTELRMLLEKVGYSIEDIRYYDTLGFVAAYVFKLLRMKPTHVTKGKLWFFDRIVFPFNRITDPIFRRWFGKNIYAVCRRK